MLYAAGCFGSPGIVITAPVNTTTKPAPAETYASRTVTSKFSGRPKSAGSSDREYCVFAMILQFAVQVLFP